MPKYDMHVAIIYKERHNLHQSIYIAQQHSKRVAKTKEITSIKD